METEIINQGYIPLLSLIGSFVIAYIMIPTIIDVSHAKHLFDDPSDDRKLHMSAIPNLGGVAIFAGIIVTLALSGYALHQWSPYLLAGLLILFFSGIKDDLLVISPFKKLLLQVAAVVIIMGGGNVIITNLGGMFGFYQIPLWAGAMLTLFTMIVVVNAYNLIDGIDGLAAGIGIIASLFFGWWFWQVGMKALMVLSFATMGALLAFLRYNFQPASIFMGDTGSQIIGYLLAFLAVMFVKTGVAPGVAVPFKNEVPVLILSVLIVPLYDTLRVFLIRALSGHSPFHPDRLHVHHQLIDMGFSHRATCYIIYGFNIGIIALTTVLAGMDVNLLLGIVLLTTVALFPTFKIKRKILGVLGIRMPSRRQIQILEMKYGTRPKKDSSKCRNGQSRGREEEYKEVAV